MQDLSEKSEPIIIGEIEKILVSGSKYISGVSIAPSSFSAFITVFTTAG